MKSFVFRVTSVEDCERVNPKRIERHVRLDLDGQFYNGVAYDQTSFDLILADGEGEMFKVGHKYTVDIREA
jgi:hypothetical protein